MSTANQSQATMPPWWPLSDEPTDDDHLGFKGYCERVAQGLKCCRSEERSLTIGVYGKWGSGKTSFLKMLGRELEDSHTIVWFEAWQYSRREELWVALLRKILATIEREHKQAKALRLRLQVWYDVKKKGVFPALAEPLWPIVWKAIAIVLWLSLVGWLGLTVLAVGAFLGAWRRIILGLFSLAPLVAIGLLGKWGLNAILGSQLGVKMEQLIGESSYASFIAFLDEFRRDFNDLVREVGQERPPVILIDDLDRCQPNEIVPVLEAIKVLTGQEQGAQDTQQDQKKACCAFVLAMDRDVVEQAIEVHYKDFVQDRQHGEASRPISGQRYLEKIVQLPIPLPPLASVNARDFIEQLVDDEEINRYRELFARGLEPTTPRQIKRVLNIFTYHRHTRPELLSDLLVKLIIIQSKWRDIYNAWATYPVLLGDLESFAQIMTATEPDLSHRFALPAPEGVERLIEQFGRWRGLTNLLLWHEEEEETRWCPPKESAGRYFRGIPAAQYLISETGGTEPMGVAQIWPSLLSGDETRVRSALQTFLATGEKREERKRLFTFWLLDHLNKDDVLKKEHAIIALAEMALPEAIDPLMEIATDKNVVIKLRQRAVHALGQIGLADVRVLGLLSLTVCDDCENLMIRLIAADVLSNSEVRTAELDKSIKGDFLSSLLDIIAPPSPGQPRSQHLLLDWRVRRLLGRLGNRDDTIIDRIIDWIFQASPAGQEGRWEVAVDILRRVEASQLASRLVINMVERHPEHRAKIEEILWAAAGEATVEGLITLARDSSAEFAHRERAIELLGRIGGDQIVEPLIDLLKDDPSVLIRAAAARVLGEMAAREHKDALQALLDDALTDPDEIVRSQAAIALPHTPPSLWPLLMDALYDKTRDSEVRHILIDTLGAIGGEEAVAALERVAWDETEDEAFHSHANQTLESLRFSW